ncbi:hypothetical protein ABW286_00910 [Erwinia papayae]|uniref:Uncharacterized protein n=1 Tax=Erwinia papayae TaxID=206499 RepID=A0ABV3MW55_9GAMM
MTKLSYFAGVVVNITALEHALLVAFPFSVSASLSLATSANMPPPEKYTPVSEFFSAEQCGNPPPENP